MQIESLISSVINSFKDTFKEELEVLENTDHLSLLKIFENFEIYYKDTQNLEEDELLKSRCNALGTLWICMLDEICKNNTKVSIPPSMLSG